MTDSKPWYESRTVWLGVITVVLALGFAVNGVATRDLSMETILMLISGLTTVFLRFDTDSEIK